MKRLMGAALCAAMLASGCSKVAPSGTGGQRNPWTKPHVLVYSDAADVNTLNCALTSDADTQYIAQLTAAYLVRYDGRNNPYPELATEIPTQADGGVSKDGLTVTYHLRHGVKWSDGAPFDADDVVFSTHVVLNPANNVVSTLGWNQVTKIDEPDKYTVTYHFSKPYSPFIQTFFATQGANPCILPKHLLAKYPNINNIAYNSKPVGIGPFYVDRWDRGSQVVMKANPLYWRGRPKLDEIVYKIVPDRNTLLTQMQTHDVDMWVLLGGAYMVRLKHTPGVTILRQPSYFWNNFDFNLTHPALKELAVREALRDGLDRETIRQKIGHGVGFLSDSPTPLTAPYAVTAPAAPFDTAKANALLDAAGWKRGADGVRAKNGVRLALTAAVNTGSQDVLNELELVRADWQKIGVTLSVKQTNPALFFAPEQQGGIVYGDKWDIVLLAWLNDSIGDYSQIYDCKAFPPAGQNVPRWCNQAAEKAMTALYSHFDQAQRNKDVAAFVQQFVQDVPVVVMTQREDIYAYNSDLKNFHPNALTTFDNMMDVDI